jgi:hypothetical protein
MKLVGFSPSHSGNPAEKHEISALRKNDWNDGSSGTHTQKGAKLSSTLTAEALKAAEITLATDRIAFVDEPKAWSALELAYQLATNVEKSLE